MKILSSKANHCSNFLLIAVLTMISSSGSTYGQAPDILWTKSYGPGVFQSVAETVNGGFIAAGRLRDDPAILQTNSQGDSLWSNSYGYGYGGTIYSVLLETNAGNFVMSGPVWSPSGQLDNWWQKTDTSGNTVWSNSLNLTPWEWTRSLRETSDGGFILTGNTSALTKKQSQSVSQKQLEIGPFLIKTDSNGDTLWTNVYQRTDSSYEDTGSDVQQTSDGGYILAATTDFNSDFWLIKTDSIGDTVWTQQYGAKAGSSDQAQSVQQTSDGGYILAGTTDGDGWLVKTDQFGDTLWTRIYGGSQKDEINTIKEVFDGGYILAGVTHSDAWVFRTDLVGNVLWSKSFGGTASDAAHEIQKTSDGGYIIAGSRSTHAWLVRLAVDPSNIEQDRAPTPNELVLFQNFPNPFNPTTMIQYVLPRTSLVIVSIIDILGKEVRILVHEKQIAGEQRIAWDGRDQYGRLVSSGVYFYRIKAGEYVQSRKMLMLK